MRNPVRLTSRQVNLLLEVLLAVLLLSGLVSWVVDIGNARALTIVHAIAGFTIVAVAPLKVKGPVRAGFRRRRSTRWLSSLLGVLILATVGLGIVHSTGLWFGVGEWSALWTHTLLGGLAVPLIGWHLWTRPVRPSPVDVSRRALLSTGAALTVAGGALATQEIAVRSLGLAGGDRAGTGSHEIGSFDPDRLPIVSWIDDRAPDLDPDRWPLTVGGEPFDVAGLVGLTRPLVARIDCTGGWWSEQRWDVIPLADVVGESEGRSIRVTSATGYSRLFDRSAADIYLATGYDGRPLRRGHGAPLRIIAPGRRGPWWVKWVTSIEVSDRPAWLQLPFPPT